VSAGNGGIMRLAPAIIATAHQPIENAINLARISSRETHYSEEADAGAEIFGAMVWRALRETNKNNIVDIANYSTGEVFDDILSRMLPETSLNKRDLEDLGGYVVDALKIAVWGFLNFDTFRDGMLAVVELGGDTDTNGAIYGQLAGAYYGYDAIPETWRRAVYLESEIRELADELLEKQPYKIVRTRFEEDKNNAE
jgi:ADP-ribosyl-[dinitrogen reductase] hydrolase